MWSPKAKGRSLIETTSFCGFSAGLCRQNHLATVSGILVSRGFAAIFAELEFAGLRHQARFAGKSPSYASLKSYHPTSVHRRGIGAESGSIFPPNIGFGRRTCQRRHLLRALETACGPLGPEGHSLMENTPFGGFSASLRRLNQLAAAAEFCFLADWPLYSPNLNSLDFSTGSVGRQKGQATPHANLAALRPSVAAEYRRLAVV
jgi:hypothetical protein